MQALTKYKNHRICPRQSPWDSLMTTQSLNSICRWESVRKSRKRVRFDSEDSDQDRVKVQVVELMCPSSEMTTDEKECTWYHKRHYKGNLKNAHIIARMHKLKDEYEVNYSVALASTYASCSLDHADAMELSEHCAQHLAVASNVESCSVEGESNRGLEKITVPMVGLETGWRRKKTIVSVLLAQRALKESINPIEKFEILRNVSEHQSKCARNFAKAMGTADAMSAFIEYGSTSNNEALKDNSTSRGPIPTRDPSH